MTDPDARAGPSALMGDRRVVKTYGYQYRASVEKSRSGRWGWVIERHFIAWDVYDASWRTYRTKEAAVAAANRALDKLEPPAGPPVCGEPV